MMEVGAAEDGAADLLMECDEEEQEVWPQSPKRDEEADEGEVLQQGFCSSSGPHHIQ